MAQRRAVPARNLPASAFVAAPCKAMTRRRGTLQTPESWRRARAPVPATLREVHARARSRRHQSTPTVFLVGACSLGPANIFKACRALELSSSRHGALIAACSSFCDTPRGVLQGRRMAGRYFCRTSSSCARIHAFAAKPFKHKQAAFFARSARGCSQDSSALVLQDRISASRVQSKVMAPGASSRLPPDDAHQAAQLRARAAGPRQHFQGRATLNRDNAAAKFVVVPPAEAVPGGLQASRAWACLFWGLRAAACRRRGDPRKRAARCRPCSWSHSHAVGPCRPRRPTSARQLLSALAHALQAHLGASRAAPRAREERAYPAVDALFGTVEHSPRSSRERCHDRVVVTLDPCDARRLEAPTRSSARESRRFPRRHIARSSGLLRARL